jgi:C-terminal domain 7 of the ABC-three component (ABC-3C) systems
VILREDFHREYTAYVRRVDRDIILAGFAGKPSSAHKLERLLDTFVQQLDLIDRSFDDKLSAISDFLRASYDRAMWSKAGDVHDDSFAELDDQLDRTWQNLSVAVDVEGASKSKVRRGQLLYAKCMMYTTRVQGMETPPYFIPGCFHRLADDLVVGWHPDYRALLKNATGERR